MSSLIFDFFQPFLWSQGVFASPLLSWSRQERRGSSSAIRGVSGRVSRAVVRVERLGKAGDAEINKAAGVGGDASRAKRLSEASLE